MSHAPDKNPEYVAKIAEGDALGRANVSEAISCYEQAFEMNPDHPGPLVKRLELLRAGGGDPDDLLEDADRLVLLFPGHAAPYVARGEILSYANLHADAADDFSASIRLDPSLAGAYKGSGFSLIALGRHEDAERMYRKAVQLSPDDSEAVFYLCSELEELGRYGDALAVLEAYLPLDGGFNYCVYQHLGRVHGLLGNVEESFENYLRSVRLNRPGRGDTPLMARRYREVTKLHKKIAKLDPSNPKSFIKAGMMLLGADWRDTGIDMLRTAAHLIPEPVHCDMVALVYMRSSRYTEAIEYLERAMGMPEYSRGDLVARYVNLVICLFACGRFTEVVRWCEKARSLNIKNPEIDKRYDAVVNMGPDVRDMDLVKGGWTTKFV